MPHSNNKTHWHYDVCLIPILVLLFFAWLVKLMLGIDLPPLRVKLGDGKAHSASGAPRI